MARHTRFLSYRQVLVTTQFNDRGYIHCRCLLTYLSSTVIYIKNLSLPKGLRLYDDSVELRFPLHIAINENSQPTLDQTPKYVN